MKQSIKEELQAHVIDLIKDGAINEDNLEDAHHVAFNEDYYIIGYYQANEWLKEHGLDAWEAIQYVVEQEKGHFGESSLLPEDFNAERIVNLFVYYAGYEIDIENLFEEQKEG